MTVNVINNSVQGERRLGTVHLMSAYDTSFVIEKQEAVVVENIPVEADAIARPQDLKPFPHFRDVRLMDHPDRVIDVIIGKTLAYSFLNGEDFRRGSPDQPMGILTRWGWFVIGGKRDCGAETSLFVSIDNQRLSDQLSKLEMRDFGSIPGDNSCFTTSREE